jgi:sugar lactone lactonase YvrE
MKPITRTTAILTAAAFALTLSAIRPAAAAPLEAKLILENKLQTTEGLTLCPGNKLFTVENSTGIIYEVVDDETVKPFTKGIDHPAGMACDAEGNLYVVEFNKGNLLRISPDAKKRETLASGLKQPNGVTVAADGTIYVSESEAGKVTIVKKSGEKEILVDGVQYANGLVLDEKAQRIYIVSTLGNKVVISPTAGENKGKKKTFAKVAQAPDGITGDTAGNFYVCVYGDGKIARMDSKGNVEIIATGLKSPATPVLKDNALYITSLNGKGLYKIVLPENKD